MDEENFRTGWESAGSWSSRADLSGSGIRERLEVIRQAVLERCELCSEPAPTLQEPFPLLWSITDSMQVISSELEQVLPHFIAVDEGRLRKLTLLLPDGSQKIFEQVPLESFSTSFDGGTLSIHEGKLTIEITQEGDLLSLPDASISLYTECFTADELILRYPVFLPNAGNLSLPGDWMFGIRQLLRELYLPERRLFVSFELLEYTGVMRDLTLLTCPAVNEWVLNGERGTGTLSEDSAWSRTGENFNGSGYARNYRFSTEHPGSGDDPPFGEGVPYQMLEAGSSSWSHSVKNLSRQMIARTSGPLSVQVCYACRHDTEGDLPFLTGDVPEGSWQILNEGVLAHEENMTFSSAPIRRPASGNGVDIDRYRRYTLRIECVIDHCGLNFL